METCTKVFDTIQIGYMFYFLFLTLKLENCIYPLRMKNIGLYKKAEHITIHITSFSRCREKTQPSIRPIRERSKRCMTITISSSHSPEPDNPTESSPSFSTRCQFHQHFSPIFWRQKLQSWNVRLCNFVSALYFLAPKFCTKNTSVKVDVIDDMCQFLTSVNLKSLAFLYTQLNFQIVIKWENFLERSL